MFATTPEREETQKPRYEYTDRELAERDAVYNDSLYDFARGEQELAEGTELDAAPQGGVFDQWKAELASPDTETDPNALDRNRGGIDISHIDNAVADRTALGGATGVRRQHIAEAHDALRGNDSLAQRQFNEQVTGVASDITENIGELGGEGVDTTEIAERLEGEMIQDALDGDDPSGDTTNINTDDLNEARRAVEAAYTLEQIEEGNTEVLNRLSDSTAEDTLKYEQDVHENGGADQMNNEYLARLGQKIEQGSASDNSGEMVSYIGEDGQIHRVEKGNRARSLAESWMNGDWNEGRDVDHATRDKVFYYLETVRERENLNDPTVRRKVISEIAHTITIDAHDSDREKADAAL